MNVPEGFAEALVEREGRRRENQEASEHSAFTRGFLLASVPLWAIIVVLCLKIAGVF